ncbi:nucleotidyltransferase domain-containing protein [Curtobacterium sp. NPDC089689]|uniref:nucleotidyltransferase domain-containing protein n=1 Tax=Curtobacterium sp. NPDC089689 TaxID=3363968 RepID=UPI00380819D4
MRRRYDPSVDRWVPLPVADVRDLIADGRAWLSGGVALDVLLGYESRAHGDVDVSVTAEDFPDLVATLPDWLHCFAARSGLLAPLDETLDHEPLVNVWCVDSRTGSWCLQINLEAGDQRAWRYRREPSIERTWTSAISDVRGMRVVSPEVQLLWKSAAPLAKDDADRTAVAPLLDDEARDWLDAAIRTAHPESPWRNAFR